MTTRGRPWRRVHILTGLAIAALLVVLLAAPAMAGAYADGAAKGLASSPVYVNAAADPKPSAAQQAQLTRRIEGSDVPIYIAILPRAALDEAGGSAGGLATQIASALDQRGVYAVLVGNQFRAGSTRGALPSGVAPRLADEAFAAKGDQGPQATLLDFVDRVRTADAQGGGATSGEQSRSGSGAGAVIGIALAVLVVVGGGALVLSSRRRRRERERQFAQVKATAQEDLVALGEDIRALDIDTSMPNTDPEAVQHYTVAVESYQKAADAFDRSQRVEDLAQVSSHLEEGRWAMSATRAVLEHRELPERRPPCFFDPRHGPSVADVEWAPPGGAPRQVPACAADTERIRNGLEPSTRQVLVDDRQVPFYQAPAYYGPWYGGFFGGGGGFLSGLLIGNLLGGFGGYGWGGWGGLGGYGDGGDNGGDGGDGGNGGDGGDFGGGDFGGGDWGGGGDFGGGDFGGGDFGGGGDF